MIVQEIYVLVGLFLMVGEIHVPDQGLLLIYSVIGTWMSRRQGSRSWMTWTIGHDLLLI